MRNTERQETPPGERAHVGSMQKQKQGKVDRGGVSDSETESANGSARTGHRQDWGSNIVSAHLRSSLHYKMAMSGPFSQMYPLAQDHVQTLQLYNPCPIKAPFKAFVEGRDSPFQVEPREGTVEPNSTLPLRVRRSLFDAYLL
jgi:hypothetical protein